MDNFFSNIMDHAQRYPAFREFTRNNFNPDMDIAARMREAMDPQSSGAPTGPPPTSQKALRQLPTVTVAAEDLVDESNRECSICLEE